MTFLGVVTSPPGPLRQSYQQLAISLNQKTESVDVSAIMWTTAKGGET